MSLKHLRLFVTSCPPDSDFIEHQRMQLYYYYSFFKLHRFPTWIILENILNIFVSREEMGMAYYFKLFWFSVMIFCLFSFGYMVTVCLFSLFFRYSINMFIASCLLLYLEKSRCTPLANMTFAFDTPFCLRWMGCDFWRYSTIALFWSARP